MIDLKKENENLLLKIKTLQEKLASQNQFTIDIVRLAEELYWGPEDKGKCWQELIDRIEVWRGWKEVQKPKRKRKKRRRK